MTWTAIYLQDTSEPGVGTVSATHDAPAASHRRRLNTNDGKDIEAFKAECEQQLSLVIKLSGDAEAVVAKIAAALNGG